MKIKKILHLHRLTSILAIKILICQAKRALRLNLTSEQIGLKYYFNLLIDTDSVCKKNCLSELITLIPSGMKIISRKYPSSDLDVFRQIWDFKQYQPIVDLMNKNVSQNDNLRIIDAGGNVGYTSLFLKEKFPNSKIIVLEPEISNFLTMEHNFKINKMRDIIPLCAGLWKHQCFLEVYKDFGDGREWSYYVKEVAYPTELRGYGILDLMKMYNWENIDLLKIDIEGTERYLFEDELKASKFLSKTKFIAIEIHDEFANRKKIYSNLSKNNFKYFESGELTIANNITYN
jgi:FkbM family methyltransferase